MEIEKECKWAASNSRVHICRDDSDLTFCGFYVEDKDLQILKKPDDRKVCRNCLRFYERLTKKRGEVLISRSREGGSMGPTSEPVESKISPCDFLVLRAKDRLQRKRSVYFASYFDGEFYTYLLEVSSKNYTQDDAFRYALSYNEIYKSSPVDSVIYKGFNRKVCIMPSKIDKLKSDMPKVKWFSPSDTKLEGHLRTSYAKFVVDIDLVGVDRYLISSPGHYENIISGQSLSDIVLEYLFARKVRT